MPAKYVLTEKNGRYHWNLLATNGRVIATSEVYNSKAAAMTGVRSVQKNGATDVVVTARRRPPRRRHPPRRPLRRADTEQPLRPRVPPVEVPAQPPTLSGRGDAVRGVLAGLRS